jgi:hypothetical protein
MAHPNHEVYPIYKWGGKVDRDELLTVGVTYPVYPVSQLSDWLTSVTVKSRQTSGGQWASWNPAHLVHIRQYRC